MFKLTIVSGPNRGSSFELIEGENSIGRDENCQIVLSSGRVSKRHCTLVLRDGDVTLKDEGSTNGTFLNGGLVKRQELQAGDKISVGDFVLELVGRTKRGKIGNDAAILFDGSAAKSIDLKFQPSMVAPPVQLSVLPKEQPNRIVMQEPDDPIGKIKVQFEAGVMPFFYGWLMKSDLKSVLGSIIAVLTIVAALAALVPTLDLVSQSVNREALIRAKVLARGVADRFSADIANHSESQIDLSYYEREPTIRLAAITAPSLAIIAPQARINQMLAGGLESSFLVNFAKQVQNGLDKGRGAIVGPGVATYVEPIVVTDSRTARPIVAAFAVVSVDFSSNEFADSDHSVFYATAGLIGLLISMACMLLIYRLVLKPFEVLSDELDQVLRGSLPRVTNEFKIPELKSLWDSINTLAQKSGAGISSQSNASMNEQVSWTSEASVYQALADARNEGFCAFDSSLNLVAINTSFEDLSGIRSSSVGANLSQVGRDRAFISLVEDLKSRVAGLSYGAITDEFEFSGNAFVIQALGIGPSTDRGVAILFRKKEG
jgi:PAS domain-containing protein